MVADAHMRVPMVVTAHGTAVEVTDLDTVVADLETALDIDPSAGGV